MHSPCGRSGIGVGLWVAILLSVPATIFMSLRLAPSTARPTGMPAASTNKLRLVPCLARSVGFLPVFFPPEGRLGHAPVHAQPRPVDAFPVIVGQQAGFPHPLKDTSLHPFLEAVMGRRPRAEAGGVQGFPLTAGAEHKENRLHTNAIRRAPVSAAGTGRVPMFWDSPGGGPPQRPNHGPL